MNVRIEKLNTSGANCEVNEPLNISTVGIQIPDTLISLKIGVVYIDRVPSFSLLTRRHFSVF